MRWLILLLFLVACSSGITQEQAAGNAKDFIQKQVRFFATDGDIPQTLFEYQFTAEDSYETDSEYVFAYHVEATYGNETKKNDITITVDKKTGLVTSLNDQRVR